MSAGRYSGVFGPDDIMERLGKQRRDDRGRLAYAFHLMLVRFGKQYFGGWQHYVTDLFESLTSLERSASVIVSEFSPRRWRSVVSFGHLDIIDRGEASRADLVALKYELAFANLGDIIRHAWWWEVPAIDEVRE